MPIFDQRCPDCGLVFEVIVLVSAGERPCPRCQCPSTEQLISTCSFRLAERKFEVKRGRSHNPYENLTLQHIRDENNKPITVNSEREMRAAEKRYNFVHAATWGLENKPPQHESWAGDVSHGKPRVWNRDPAAYKPENVKGVSTGIAADPHKDTLVDRPNATVI
jgi:putative FmdB family regulatory protein